MARSEHPAAKAGRFVRAATRASAAAAREFDKTTKERAQAPSAPAAPRPQAPLPPPLPPFPTKGLVGRAAFFGLVCGAAALALVGLRVGSLIHTASTRRTFELVLAAIMLIEAALLVANWRGATQSLVQRFCNHVWGHRGAETRREKAFARLVRDVVTMIGIVLLAGAVYTLIAATTGT